MFSYYDVLGVKETAGPEVIKAAYKALAQKWHPDKHMGQAHQAESQFRMVNEAFEVLSNPAKRAAYDEWLFKSQNSSSSIGKSPSTISRIWSGDFSPAITFFGWIGGAGLILAAIVSLVSAVSFFSAFIGWTLFVVFEIYAHVGLWRALRRSRSRSRYFGFFYFFLPFIVPLVWFLLLAVSSLQISQRNNSIEPPWYEKYPKATDQKPELKPWQLDWSQPPKNTDAP